ncbi:MAG: hypothetical protein AB1505_32030 [Candidatus Latescibacterota bacterium]
MAPVSKIQQVAGRPGTAPVPAWRLLRERALRCRQRLLARHRAAAAGPVDTWRARPTASGFPVSTQGLFTGSRPCLLAVLDGQVVQVLRRPPGSGEAWAAVAGERLAARSWGGLGEHLERALRRASGRVEEWVYCRHAARLPLPAGYLALSEETRAAVAAFVRHDLVPRLQAEAANREGAIEPAGADAAAAPGAAVPADRRSADGSPLAGARQDDAAAAVDWVDRVVTETLARWPRWYAFGGISRHDLVPYWGPARRGRLHLTWGKATFTALSRRPVGVAAAEQDHVLEAVTAEVLGLACATPRLQDTVYQDAVYSVLAAPSGQHYCCRRIPAYVVEDHDGTLYQFPAAQVGIRVDGTEPRRVLHPASALVMHRYWHPFVFAGASGAPICMPLPPPYFEELHRLPLAEGLLRHLESARIVLCSGYHAGNPTAGYHPISGGPTGQTVTESAARAAGLAIYRYRRDGKA